MLGKLVHYWLTRQIDKPVHNILFSFDHVLADAQPGDVWLVEGHTRLSRVISVVTRSPWTHALLYIGKPKEFLSTQDCQKLSQHYHGSLDEPLIIESRMGHGVVVNPAHSYHRHHVRVCRPQGLLAADVKKVIRYAIERLGDGYDTLQVLDLARFLYPWHILPRRWHSSLFSFKAGTATKLTCSCLLADAFESIEFPILPGVRKHKEDQYEFILRNPKLFTPRDFDYSPFFEILKYPVVTFSKTQSYRQLQWNRSLISNDDGQYIKLKESPEAYFNSQ